MAKVWIIRQYNEKTATEKDNPFYIGDVVEGTVVGVVTEARVAADYKEQTGGEFNAETNNKFKYLANQGEFMLFNPKLAESAAAIPVEGTDKYRVYAINSINTNKKAGGKEIVVEAGRKNAAGEDLYYHLKFSNTFYAAGNPASDFEKFRSSEEAPVGRARTIQGATGQLCMATNQTFYNRDVSKTGKDINEKSATKGTFQSGQANTYGYVQNPEVVEAAADEKWHYYTITLTDEWFQVYVDGVACDPNKSVAWYGNTFNQGSGMYKPNGSFLKSKNAKSDFEKLNNDNWLDGKYLFGQLFGQSVMSYITDPNTKLYIGGKTQNTAAGTRIDSMAFYTEAFTREQAAAEYAARKDVADAMLGDVDGNGKITAEDALAVLKTVVGAQPDDYNAAAADVDKNGKVTAEDALAILKHVVGAELIK